MTASTPTRGTDPLELAARIAAGAAGAAVVATTLLSAVRTVVVPRAEGVALTRAVLGVVRAGFDVLVRLREGYDWTDRVMGMYGPVALLALPLCWLLGLVAGFGALLWAVGERPLAMALEISGSSLLTLGITPPETAGGVVLSYLGAALTLAIVVLLLVTYLPSLYSAFSRREREVALLEARAGIPPTAVEMLVRMGAIDGLGRLAPMWEAWEEWFADVAESHTSLPGLVFFRSQRADQSWLTAAGAVLDAASLFVACVDHAAVSDDADSHTVAGLDGGHDQLVRTPDAELCIRAGYLCLRDVAGFLGLPYDPDPSPDDPISITRREFDDAWDDFAAAGVPLVDDREAAWRAFAGWRVNYDGPLLRLADHIAAPPTPWVSDRSPPLPGAPRTDSA